MKFFTFIFSFYMLGLSCLPCSDTDECKDKLTVMVTAPINHDKHSHEEENCTPFCSCSCCATSVSLQTIASYKIPKRIFPSTKYPVYKVSYNSQFSFSIWQPPKLALLLY